VSEVSIRVDKWLWYARFFKSRSMATQQVEKGKVRINRTRVRKASATLKIGDVLTFTQGRQVKVVTVEALGVRRGPAVEAQTLYRNIEEVELENSVQRNTECSKS